VKSPSRRHRWQLREPGAEHRSSRHRVTDTIDTTTVKLTDTSVAEGGTVTYTATVGAPVTGSPVVVTLANGQTITIEVGKPPAP
jgi:hypothetical protein